MRGLTRRNIIAIVAGVLFAGIPVVAFDFWLGGIVDKRAQAEISIAARRAVALAGTRVGQASTALDALTAERIPGDGSRSLDIIRLGGSRIMVRLRRKVGAGGNEVAALIPAAPLLPQATIAGSDTSAFVKLVAPGGVLVGVAGVRPTRAEPQFSVSASSDVLGFTYEIVVPRSRPRGSQLDGQVGHRRDGAGHARFYHADAAARFRQSGGGAQGRSRQGRVHSLLLADRRHPLRPVARRRGARALAQARWHAGAARLVHPADGIEWPDPRHHRHLMRQVCTEAGAAIGARPALKVSFNFAGQLFGNDSIVREVRNVFANSPIRMSQVVLEVTERDPIENFTETRRTIAALQGLGVRIAIDDVGTGHNGLSYMLKLGVDIIKIDKMFVDAIGTDRNSTTIVETLVDLAHNMHMDIVAEGVETFEQVVHLRELGIQSAQGYVFAPPLPGSSFLKLVETIDPLKTEAGEQTGPPDTPYYESAHNRIHAA